MGSQRTIMTINRSFSDMLSETGSFSMLSICMILESSCLCKVVVPRPLPFSFPLLSGFRDEEDVALEISKFTYMPKATPLKTNQIGGTVLGPYRFFSCELGRLRGIERSEGKKGGRKTEDFIRHVFLFSCSFGFGVLVLTGLETVLP